VYSYVIGEHLPSEKRLKLIEFINDNINNKVIDKVVNYVLYPQDYMREMEHNKMVVKNRYNLDVMVKNIKYILYKLFLQLCDNTDNMKLAIWAFQQNDQITETGSKNLKYILNTSNRQYLPGYGKMRFLIFLKSLIDPSYFRVEEQRFRGLAMEFASNLVKYNPDPTPLSLKKVHNFYNAVDNLFLYRNGDVHIRIDYSFDYRHRNKNHYPYRDLTFQELTGVITILFNKIASPPPCLDFNKEIGVLSEFDHAIFQLTNSFELIIDHKKRLKKRLAENVPIALFPGNYINYEMEFFVLQPLRKRLGLKIDEELTTNHLDAAKNIAPIYIIKHSVPIGLSVTADALKSYISASTKSEIKLLFEYGLCKIIKSNQVTVGVHFEQLGKKALQVLKNVKERNGFIIASGDHSAMMTDIVDLETFHIGKVTKILASKIMGIPIESAYLQWVPAGLRACLAYPTPTQTCKDFSDALKSVVFKKLAKKYGEKKLLEILKQDAETNGSPIMKVLKSLISEKSKKENILTSNIMGVYSDGLPWAGVIAKVPIEDKKQKWKFRIMVGGKNETMTVLRFCDIFHKRTGKAPKIAWNGGYILNAELIGKLGIPEAYIGSSLGLVISRKKVLSPPLFNKPALGIFSDGTLKMKRVNCSQGITIVTSNKEVILTKDNYNYSNPLEGKPYFYDLMYPNEYIKGDGRVIYRLSGNIIKEIIHTKKGEDVKILPVGLTFSFPNNLCPKGWDKIEKEVVFKLHFWKDVEYALEAGPMLVNEGKVCINMELEGWKTENSIRTQAARLDFMDMRGPKIAVGFDAKGNLTILTVNGRIRESVGATHNDMAEILLSRGIITAMGFDPGGSSTLVVNNKTLNISPYNHEYEKNIYTFPPEPRAVANVIIGWQ
ncbi:phosphodiester glycosidase family protein, partial [bacterium]|nr:phosphodiester glycosidase family protein [bacterium]